MMHKSIVILKETVPIFLMIGLVPLVKNDYVLTALYCVIICCMFIIARKKYDGIVFIVGLVSMTFFESIFLMTGVETFIRNSLFGIMPLWLPFLWAYGFVVMKRSLAIIQG